MSNSDVKSDDHHIQTLMTSNVPKMVKYMRFIGLLQIIYGVLNCLTIIGAVIGVPLIFIGFRIREAAKSFTTFLASDSKQDLSRAVERQTRSFHIQYVLAIISLILIGIFIIAFIAFEIMTLGRIEYNTLS